MSADEHYNYFGDCHTPLGRFIASFPVNPAGGLNALAYVGANRLVRANRSDEDKGSTAARPD